MKKLFLSTLALALFAFTAFMPTSGHAIRKNVADANGSFIAEELDVANGMHQYGTFVTPFNGSAVSNTAVASAGFNYIDVSVTPAVNTATVPYHQGYEVTIANTGTDWLTYQTIATSVTSTAVDGIPLAVSASATIHVDNGARLYYVAPAGATRIRVETRYRKLTLP